MKPGNEDLLAEAIEATRRAGADDAAALIESERSAHLRFARNRITRHSEMESLSMILSVAVEHREASISLNKLDRKILRETAERVVSYARKAPRNPEFVAPIPPQKYKTTETWFESSASLTPDDRAMVAREICELAQANDVELFGSLNVVDGGISVANSAGLYATQEFTEVTLPVTARTKSGKGSGQSTESEADWRKVDPSRAAGKAVDSAIRSRNPRRIEPGEYTVILAPAATLEYFLFFLMALDARDAEEGRSFFSNREAGGTKIGEKLFGDDITIRSCFDDPRLPCISFGGAFGSGGSSAGFYFTFGLPMRNHTWVERGRLASLRESPYWAVTRGREPVGYPLNMVMDGGETSVEELIRETQNGIYISSLWYTGPTDMNEIMVTGLTRDGTFLIEGGELTDALCNFRFNDSPIRTLNNVVALGKQEKREGEFIASVLPYLKVADFTLTSVSDAV